MKQKYDKIADSISEQVCSGLLKRIMYLLRVTSLLDIEA